MEQRKVYLQPCKREKRDIEFDNLSYIVKYGKGKKHILKGVSGMFKSGELTAIMGPSGAGKSSLLNILSGFQKTGTSGMIRCSGQEEKATGKVQYKRDSCYILQDDRLCPLFSVWETMLFAARLKLGRSLTDSARDWLISNILDTLGLAEAMHTRCNRLSGGQRKRLSIALELIDNPPIMFLDEPTTGLDSLSSFQCVSVLKHLARDGRTIICTIHQPSASIFELFDHVYVLAEGQCLYQGTAMNTIPFLSSVGLNCPQYHNPADHLLEVANREYGDFNEALTKVTRESNWRVKLQTNKMVLTQPSRSHLLDGAERTMVLIQKPSEFYRFRVLVMRNMIQLYRDWTVLHLRFILHFLVGVFIGLLYMDYGTDGSKTIKNVGYYIVSLVYLSYTSMMPAVVKLPSEVPVLRKESFNNWFRLSTYYTSYIAVHFPVHVMFAVLYTMSSYFLTGQILELSRLLMFTLIMILSTLTAESIGVILGTTVNPVNGTFFGAIMTAFFICVAGFLMLFTHMSKVMYGLSYISYIAYGMEGSVEAMYRGRESLPCPENIEYCHFKTPDILLNELGMNKGNYYYDVLYLSMHTNVHIKIMAHIVIAVFLGLLYQGIGNDNSRMVSNIGYFATTSVYLGYTSMLPAVLTMPQEAGIVRKETFNNWYNLKTYYATVVLLSIPQHVIYSVIYTFITYVLSDQPLEPLRYLIFATAAIFLSLIADSIGTIIGTCVRVSDGTFLAGVFSAYIILLSGFFVLINQSPLANILSYTSYARYALHAFVQSVLGYNRTGMVCSKEYCHYNAIKILEEFSMNVHPVYIDWLYLGAIYVTMRVIGYFTLNRLMKAPPS